MGASYYADDVLLYRPIRQASDFQLLQQDVDALGLWSGNNYQTFNPSKCKSMVFSSIRDRLSQSLPTIH